MPVMMTAEVAGQTAEGYDQVLQHVGDAVRRAPGFLLHTSHAVEGGWRVIEVWDSKAAADAFYVEHIVPMLPPGIRPKRSYQPLHSLVLPETARSLG